MKSIGLIILAIFLNLAFCACAQAAEMPVVPTAYLVNLNSVPAPSFLERLNADRDIYNNCPVSKAGDGAVNAIMFWMDVPKAMSEEAENSNLIQGATLGFVSGLFLGAERGAAGLVDVATCSFPPYDKPLIAPDYKVDNPDKDGFKVKLLSW